MAARNPRTRRPFAEGPARPLAPHYREISAIRSENEREAQRTQDRHASERQSLIGQQHAERAALQKEFKELRSRQATLLSELRKEVGRYLRMARVRNDSTALSKSRGSGLKLQR